MSDPFKDEFVPNIQSANKTSYNQWKSSNPGEAQKWEAYRDAVIAHAAKPQGTSPTPPALQTKYGKALVAAGKLQVSVTDIGADYSTPPETPPPPPPTGNPYFVTDYSSGRIGPPWVTLFSYASPGFVDLTQTGPVTGTSDGNVRVVNDPAGSGRKVLRFEIKDADPDWAVVLNPPVDKSEVRSQPQYTWNASQASYGDIRWFSMKYYMPYSAGGEKFEWAHTGGNAFFDLNDMHPNNNSWPAVQVGWYPQSAPEWAKLRVGGGAVVGDTSNINEYNLWQLTDSNGSRHLANYNRWLTVTLGIRWHYDFTGWIEAYIDGNLVIPRTPHPTMWANDFPMYWKGGLYKQANAVFPESGRSVIYWDTQKIGLVRSDVD